jgi:3-oxoacyl-[acyl-carrier protein] reductase
MNLKNKKVIITGATGGIGYSLVKKFVNSGSIVLASGTNETKLNTLKSDFNSIIIEKFKLDEHQKIESFIETCNEKLGGLDILINNAGIALDNLSIRLSEENWKKVLDINLTATFLMCKFAIKKMLKSKSGKIINMSKKKVTDYIEIGPGKVLTGMVKRTIKNINCFSINSIDDMKKLTK